MRGPSSWPLTFRVALLSALGVLAVTLISTLIARELLIREISSLRDRELNLLAEHVAADARDGLQSGLTEAAFGPPRFAEIYSGAYWQIDAGDDEPLRSRSLWDTRLGDVRPDPDRPDWGDATGPAGQALRTMSLELPTEAGQARLTVAMDTAEFDRFEGEMGRLFMLALIAEGFLALLAASLVAWLSLDSLRRFTREIAALRAGDITEVSEDFPSEVAIAAQEVNALKTAQTNLITRARDQAGSLAHSLKTPLSVIIQATERSDTVPSRSIRDQAEAALTHVQHHLVLARSAGAGVRHAPVPVGPVVDAILRVLRPQIEDRDLDVRLDIDDRLALRIDEADLHDVIGNLLDNAVGHAGATVRVCGTISGGGTVSIADDGPGLSEAEIAEALERGRSLSGKPGSTGLGLTLTRELVASYGGEFTVERSDLGGLEVRFRMSAPEQAVREDTA
ncbi:MAG: sensor histidine kinase [Minwuia sp.]|uniref:sensor histidine kinase n=1 Tax=Minwuia sp. TaxID=2493630 RepID=UPI003A83A330